MLKLDMERIRKALESEFDSCCLLYGADATSHFIEYLMGLKLLLSDHQRMEVNRAAHDIILKTNLAGFKPYKGV